MNPLFWMTQGGRAPPPSGARETHTEDETETETGKAPDRQTELGLALIFPQSLSGSLCGNTTGEVSIIISTRK